MNTLALLAEKKLIDPADIAEIEEEASAADKPVDEILVARGVDPQQILSILEEKYQVPSRLVGDEEIKHEVLQYIPEESALHYKFVPLGVRDSVLEVGVVDPDNIEALDALNFISAKINLPFKVFLVLERDFRKVLGMYEGLSGEVGRALTEIEGELKAGDDASQEDQELGAIDTSKELAVKEDAPVTKIVATILRYAVDGKASDVHIEPAASQVRVRFRVDGVLNTSLLLPRNVLSAVVARIKILSSMRLDEKRKPQDGRFPATIQGRRIEFRVSTFPSHHGEKIVMRILDRSQHDVTLASLGLSDGGSEIIRRAIAKPFGMVIIAGPTGSGKSTTLYAILNEVDRLTKNAISLEDPVEYDIDGVSQSQVRPEIGYSFASGLRSILRQDPDIIMVGEIRDKETAQLAVQAALTGHLVFSTLHTNTAIGVVPRLVDMGVDPYLIAPTLILAVGQRLVRTLCPGAGKKIPIEGGLKVMIDKQFEDLPDEYKKNIPSSEFLYGIQSTPECPNGTRGRTGAFEFLEIDRNLEEIILKGGGENEIEQAARQNGMLSMKEDAIVKAMEGKVPFEEVNTLGGTFLIDDVPGDYGTEPKE